MSVSDKIANHVEKRIKASDCKLAFIEPGSSSMIDLMNPETGKSCIYAETLDQIRERYPTAQIVNVDEWLAAKALVQDSQIEWTQTTEEEYEEMLGVLPPALMTHGYFLVGEPWDHHATNGKPRYQAYGETGNMFVKSNRPITRDELRAMFVEA